MSRERALRGSCSCGRNRYTVEVPEHATEVAQVLFESGGELSRHQASPLTAFLRIPLTWYRSTAEPFFPDESHTSIRRVYSAPTHPHSKRYFCGYCGTPLSFWTERPTSEAEYISLTLGSLVGDDLRELEDLGLVPPEVSRDAQAETEDVMKLVAADQGSSQQQQQQQHDDIGDGLVAGVPWFESMMEGSLLGQLTRSHRINRARTTRELGGVSVEWEIVEWTNNDAEGGGGDDDASTGGDVAGGAVAGTGAQDMSGEAGAGADSRATPGDGQEAGGSSAGGSKNGENGSTKRKIGDMQEGGEDPTRRQQATVEDEADVEMKS